MSNQWKKFETSVARTLQGRRFWANSGEAIDVESDRFVVQCKNVARMSLKELTDLCEVAGEQGEARGKIGMVAVKLRAGMGIRSSTVYAMTERSLAALLDKNEASRVSRGREAASDP